MAGSDRAEERSLLVTAASRTLRRQLRALTWVTLEEVALDAVAEDGQLVARTSARQVAEHLRVDPLAVAGALKVLRDRGLHPPRTGPGAGAPPVRPVGLRARPGYPGLTVVDAGLDATFTPLSATAGSRRGSGADAGRRERGAGGASRRVASVCAGLGCWG